MDRRVTLRACLRELGGIPWHAFDLAILVAALRRNDEDLEEMSFSAFAQMQERVDGQMAHLESLAEHDRETKRWRDRQEIRSDRLC